ncbi:MAG TPA: hypothetical protein VFY96_04730 [Candidatus Binatia bacterium]|nr:hypothetical protein [Candidatus Binatia bacterium]
MATMVPDIVFLRKSCPQACLAFFQVSEGSVVRLQNPRVCLTKNPIRATEYKRKDTETKPETPKPNRMPAQLRFRLSNAVLESAILAFELSDPLISSAEFFIERFGLCVCTERQLKFLAYLEIALQNSRILFFDFLFRDFQGRRNNVEVVAGSYRPRLALSG